jgi:hypothetical protein
LPRIRSIKTEIEINAPSAVVWKVLTDLPAYGSWNPFIRRISGELTAGRHIRVYARLPCGLPMVLRPKVLEIEVERRFRWLGSLLMPGVLDGEHLFMIDPIAKNKVRFIQREEYSGVLLGTLWSWLSGQGQGAFELMNNALKTAAERLIEKSP